MAQRVVHRLEIGRKHPRKQLVGRALQLVTRQKVGEAAVHRAQTERKKRRVGADDARQTLASCISLSNLYLIENLGEVGQVNGEARCHVAVPRKACSASRATPNTSCLVMAN